MEQSILESLNKIDWQPKDAAFQLSPNLAWARCERRNETKEQIEQIQYHVERSWGLKPFGITDWFYYFH